MKNLKILLKEYVNALNINEDDTGGAGYGGFGDYGGYGMGMGYNIGGPSLYQTFIEPFVDVARTTAGAIEKGSARTQALVKTLVESILSNIIPFTEAEFEEIFEEEAKQLEAVKLKYAEVKKRVDEAFTDDAVALAFMLSPTLVVGIEALKLAPANVLSLFNIFAGGNEKLEATVASLKDKLYSGKHGKERFSTNGGFKMTVGGKQFRGYDFAHTTKQGHILREDEIENKKTQITWRDVVSSPEVAKEFGNSEIVRQMHADAKTILNKEFNAILSSAKKLMSVGSVEDVEKITGKKIDVKNLNNISTEDKQNLDQLVTTQVKSAVKNFYVKQLQVKVKKLTSIGIKSNHPMIVAYNKLIKTIGDM